MVLRLHWRKGQLKFLLPLQIEFVPTDLNCTNWQPFFSQKAETELFFEVQLKVWRYSTTSHHSIKYEQQQVPSTKVND